MSEPGADPDMARLLQMQQLLEGALREGSGLLHGSRQLSSHAARMETQLSQARAELRESDEVLRRAQQVRSHLYYKVVAKVGGRYFSVFDGQTEFRLGERIAREPCHGHRGAFFVYADAQRARDATFPAASRLRHAHKALLRVRGETAHGSAAHAHGDKQLLWALTPLSDQGEARVHVRPRRHAHAPHANTASMHTPTRDE